MPRTISYLGVVLIPVLIHLPSAYTQAGCSFVDSFNGTEVDPSMWDFPTGTPSFYGKTQIRAGYPDVSNGCVLLRVDTFNPTAITPGDSFYGSEIFTKDKYTVGLGCRAEIRARLLPPIRGGLVAGMFFYIYSEDTKQHSEIDWELLSNYPNHAHTNVYADESFGPGRPILVPIPGGRDITQFNTYRIDWLPDRVRWYVNDILVREEKDIIPEKDMAFHLNFWVPGPDWERAYDPTFQPAETPDKNETFWFCVDWVKISRAEQFPWELFIPTITNNNR